MFKYVDFKPVWILIALLLLTQIGFSATTGKVAGVVKDNSTGEPLPGANVVIEGTSMGGATDIDGNYFIINVPPGTYQLRVTFIGYTSKVVENVLVQIDRTARVDFAIDQESITGEEVTVTADREIIRQDVSFSQNNMSADKMQAVPASMHLDNALVSQAGVEQGEKGIEIRGSNYKEIGYYLDGVSLRNERMDQGMSMVSTTAIQEVQLLTGGFNAEFGNARAGIVNIVSKTPQQKYFFNMETRVSPLMGGDDPDYPGLKHFGPYIFSNNNWWEYGRYDWNGGAPSADKNGDGEPDFEGWTSWAANNTYGDESISAEDAFKIWQWRHRSEDTDGNVLYDGKEIGTVDQLYNIPSVHDEAFNWYGYQSDWVGDFSFGGPVPFTNNKLSFVLSHIRENSMYAYPTSTGGVYGWNTTQGKLIYQISPDMKIVANGLYTDMKTFENGDPEPREGTQGLLSEGVQNTINGNNSVYNRDSGLVPKGIYTTIANATFTHTLNPSTYYDVKMTYANADYQQLGNVRLRTLGDVYQVNDNIWLDESPKGWAYQQGASSDILGLYGLRGERSMDMSQTQTFQFNYDITSQVNANHQFKAGVEYLYKDVLERTGYTQNYLFIINEDFRNGDDGIWGTEDDGAPGDQANWHDVHTLSWQGAAYVQDKMEYGGMILNLGLRLDVVQPNDSWFDRNDLFFPRTPSLWNEHWMRYGDNAFTSGYENYYGLEPDVHPDMQWYLSPRLGVSHPIGPESKIYFNYGHFYDTVTNDWLYRWQVGYDEPVEEMGNPWLLLPKTVQFETGWEQRLFGNYVANVSAYYKDVTQDIDDGSMRGRDGGPSYEWNSRARDIKGFEFNVEKRYGTFITGFFNADYSIEKGYRYGWSSIYHPESPEFASDPTMTDQLRVLGDTYVSDTQQPGSWKWKLNVALHSPADWGPGPVVGDSKLLGWWDFSVSHYFRQGRSYIWNPNSLQRMQGVYNGRVKNYNRTDLHLEKRFQFAGISAGAFMDITNLFNIKNLNQYMDWDDQRVRFERLVARQENGDWKEMEKKYYDALEAEGKSFGDEVEGMDSLVQRLYYFWDVPRDYWFGLRLYF